MFDAEKQEILTKVQRSKDELFVTEVATLELQPEINTFVLTIGDTVACFKMGQFQQSIHELISNRNEKAKQKLVNKPDQTT